MTQKATEASKHVNSDDYIKEQNTWATMKGFFLCSYFSFCHILKLSRLQTLNKEKASTNITFPSTACQLTLTAKYPTLIHTIINDKWEILRLYLDIVWLLIYLYCFCLCVIKQVSNTQQKQRKLKQIKNNRDNSVKTTKLKRNETAILGDERSLMAQGVRNTP